MLTARQCWQWYSPDKVDTIHFKLQSFHILLALSNGNGTPLTIWTNFFCVSSAYCFINCLCGNSDDDMMQSPDTSSLCLPGHYFVSFLYWFLGKNDTICPFCQGRPLAHSSPLKQKDRTGISKQISILIFSFLQPTLRFGFIIEDPEIIAPILTDCLEELEISDNWIAWIE